MSARELPPDSPLSARNDALGELLRKSNQEFAANVDTQASLRRLEVRLNQPPRARPWPMLSFAPAVLLLLWFVGSHLPAHEATVPRTHAPVRPPPSTLALEQEAPFVEGKTALPDGSVVQLEQGGDARWRRTTRGIRVRVSRGQVRCAVQKQRGDQRFVVEAGGYAFVVLGTELSVRRSEQVSELEVSSGRVEVRRDDHTLAFVTAGGSWRGPTLFEHANVQEPVAAEPPAPEPTSTQAASKPRSEPRLPAPEPEPAPAASEDCAALVRKQAFHDADGCYARAAQGSGLTAELALYERSRLRLSALHDAPAALRALEEHRRRFPAGVLTKQVELAHVRTLAALGRFGEALEALEPILARGGPQQAELQALKDELTRKQADHTRPRESF